MGYGHEINEGGEGFYLAAKVFISNIGGAPAIYNGLEGRDSKGGLFFHPLIKTQARQSNQAIL